MTTCGNANVSRFAEVARAMEMNKKEVRAELTSFKNEAL